MFPFNAPAYLREEYQARVEAALERGRRVDAARRTKREGAWTRLRAWLSTRRATRVARPRTVDTVG